MKDNEVMSRDKCEAVVDDVETEGESGCCMERDTVCTGTEAGAGTGTGAEAGVDGAGGAGKDC